MTNRVTKAGRFAYVRAKSIRGRIMYERAFRYRFKTLPGTGILFK